MQSRVIDGLISTSYVFVFVERTCFLRNTTNNCDPNMCAAIGASIIGIKDLFLRYKKRRKQEIIAGGSAGGNPLGTFMCASKAQ